MARDISANRRGFLTPRRSIISERYDADWRQSDAPIARRRVHAPLYCIFRKVEVMPSGGLGWGERPRFRPLRMIEASGRTSSDGWRTIVGLPQALETVRSWTGWTVRTIPYTFGLNRNFI